MTTTVQTYIEAIQDKIRVIDGIQAAPESLPDGARVFPFVIAYPGAGTIEHGPSSGTMKFLESIVVELHVARKHLPRDYDQAVYYVYEIPNAVFSALIAQVVAFSNITSSGLIPMDYAGQPTLGFRWTVNNVKTIQNCT